MPCGDYKLTRLARNDCNNPEYCTMRECINAKAGQDATLSPEYYDKLQEILRRLDALENNLANTITLEGLTFFSQDFSFEYELNNVTTENSSEVVDYRLEVISSSASIMIPCAGTIVKYMVQTYVSGGTVDVWVGPSKFSHSSGNLYTSNVSVRITAGGTISASMRRFPETKTVGKPETEIEALKDASIALYKQRGVWQAPEEATPFEAHPRGLVVASGGCLAVWFVPDDIENLRANADREAYR